jgi:hypothetical protein
VQRPCGAAEFFYGYLVAICLPYRIDVWDRLCNTSSPVELMRKKIRSFLLEKNSPKFGKSEHYFNREKKPAKGRGRIVSAKEKERKEGRKKEDEGSLV